MQIEYKILWLDDQIDSFIEDEYVDEIKNYLKDEGFEAIVDTVDNSDDFFSKLNDTYDLILTDYHMEKMNGDEVVRNIRNTSKIFSEILFYTARMDLKDICKIDRVSFLQTDSQGDTHEKAVVEKIKFLIDLTVQKFHDIVVMRGMIMHETSYLDAKKLSLLKKFVIEKKYEENLFAIKEVLFMDIEKFLNEKTSDILKYKKNDNLNQLMKDTVLFSASKKILAMKKILEILGEKDFSDEYLNEIINMRNKFAHSELIDDKENKRKYFQHKEDGITFDDALCKDIRRNIHKHKKNLDDLEIKLGA